MKRDDLEVMEDKLLREIARRRNLGGYSPEAPAMLMLCETLFELVRHTREKMPAPPKKKDDE